MYSSSSTDDKKKLGSASQPPLEISPYDEPAMGIPVSTSGNHKFPFQTPGGDPESEGLWSTSIFGCFDDIPNCCITCWCPCITFGQISEIVNEGSISCPAAGALYSLVGLVTGCACIYSCLYRSKLRHQYALPETPCHDCLVHCFCELCALCQEYRELKNRGFDMSRGWKGNMERQNHGVTMAPVVEKGMSK